MINTIGVFICEPTLRQDTVLGWYVYFIKMVVFALCEKSLQTIIWMQYWKLRQHCGSLSDERGECLDQAIAVNY